MNAEICRSINCKKTKDKNGKHLCEVNNSTATKHHDDLKKHAEFDYQEAKVGRQLLLLVASYRPEAELLKQVSVMQSLELMYQSRQPRGKN